MAATDIIPAMINYSIVMRSINSNLFDINQAKGRIKAAKAPGETPRQEAHHQEPTDHHQPTPQPHNPPPPAGDQRHGESHHVYIPPGEQLALLHGPLVKVVDAYPGQGYTRQHPKKRYGVKEGVGINGSAYVVGPGRMREKEGE